MKHIYLICFLFLTITTSLNAQIIDIPDANFKSALVNTNCCNSGGAWHDADFNNNGEIEESEAIQITAMNVSDESITSLTGVEYFPNLEYLNFDGNQISSIDLSFFPNLITLRCTNTGLTSLDVGDLVNLENLSCANNALSSLDLSGLVNLDDLNCRDNQLTNLDISDSLNMRWLDCRNNQLTNLDIASFTSLWTVDCQNNLLTSLIIPNLESLQVVDCGDNQLTSLTVNDSSLLGLDCENNQLTTLDLSSMSYLRNLRCDNNLISSINFDTLTLENIYCSNNQLTTLDLTSISGLETLTCTNNQLTSLNVSNQTNEFYSFYCSENNLTTLSIENLAGLIELDCQNNALTSLNVTNSGISSLNAANNELNTLDLSNTPNLYYVMADHNLLTTVDLSNSEMLEELYLSNNLLSSIDLSSCPNLNTIFATNNLLTTIDVSDNPNLCNFYCDNNNFSSIIFGEAETLIWCNPDDVFFDGSPNLSVICTTEDNFEWVQDRLNEYGYTDCAITTYCSFDPYGEYYVVQGQALLDSDSNGCDTSDTFANNQAFNISSNDFYDTFYANSQGEFELYISPGSHTITPEFENPDYFTISPASLTVEFPSDASPFMQDFCITPNGTFNDLEVTIISLDEARPGFDTTYKLIYKNKGTTVLSGSVDLTYQDDLMDLVSAVPTEDSQTGNILNWNFTDLNPFETREVLFTMNINSPMETPPVNGDDILVFSTTVSSSETDETPEDNSFTLNQTVVNSFDPNDKTCLEGETITPEQVGEYLHYRIRFENTGTANAINVVVKDNIDRNTLDLSTLVPIDASHDFFARIVDNASDYFVEFIFENINLPFDDANNDGYVVFKIKTLDTLALDDLIENEAEIYFDFNFPIITNVAETTVATLSTNEVELSDSSIVVFPNPANKSLFVKSDYRIDQVAIYDIQGRLIEDFKNNGSQNPLEVDTEKLSVGTYLLNITTDDNVTVKTFIKE